MQIIRDNLNEMDCVMIQQTVQARTSKNKSVTVEYAEKAAQGRMKDLRSKLQEERTQQMNIERWQEQAGAGRMRGTCQQRKHESNTCPSGAMSPVTANRKRKEHHRS